MRNEYILLKSEEGQLKATTKKLDGEIDLILGNTSQPITERQEIISSAVDSMLNYGEDQSDLQNYLSTIRELENKIEAKEAEISSKYLALQKDNEEFIVLQSKLNRQKIDAEAWLAKCKKDTQNLKENANILEVKGQSKAIEFSSMNSWIIM